MNYSKIVEVYEHLEKTPARLEKTSAVSRLFKETPTNLLPRVSLLVQGKVFPSWSEKEIGIAGLLMIKIIANATGFSEKEISGKFKKIGDFGLVIEELTSKKRQKTLFQKKLTIEKVFENIQKLADMTGKGSQERKFALISELISSAEPKESKYIVRTVLGDLRVGVAAGVIRDAIAKAFLPEGKESVKAVEWAWFLNPDYGEIARIAKERGLVGLKKVKLQIGKPYHVLLSEKSPSLEEAMETFEKVAIEYKYDGARISIQKSGERVWLFTRRLENVTEQFPDIVELVKKSVKAEECIIEGEILGINPKTKEPMPFQKLSQRIKRKYDIDNMVKEIPVQINLFDIVYLNGKDFFRKSLEFRWKKLESVITPIAGKFQLAKHIVTKDLKRAEEFYRQALKAKQEGVMVKNMEAFYQPGRRVGYWLKVKPTLENLDLVIIGAQWGTGKRAGFLGSYVLGCRDKSTGSFLACGMMGSGIKEKKGSGVITLGELTKLLKPYITKEKGTSLEIKPKMVVEIAYEEIQKSPNYASGFALRFPRILRLRTDKGPNDADSIERIKYIYKMQKGKRT